MIQTATENSPTVGIIMPKILDNERFSIRYAGLENEIQELGATAAFGMGHTSYDASTHSMQNVFNTSRYIVANSTKPAVIRDLTMPKDDDRPVYKDNQAPRLVHLPELNSFLKDKRNLARLLPEIHPETLFAVAEEVSEAAAAICGSLVVVKPVIGEQSQGVFIGKKASLPKSFPKEHYLVQEFIDTSGGVEELGIKNVHNVRVLSIDSKMVGAVGRINDAGGNFLHGEHHDVYGRVYLPDELPETMLTIASRVQDELKKLPGDGQNVIAIDLMRGFNAQGDEIDVLCEVNRRPLRISKYDLAKPLRDPKGIEWLAAQWDFEEAQLLVGLAKGESKA